MLSDLVLVHRTSPSSFCPLTDLPAKPGEEWVAWKTCLRTILLSRRSGEASSREPFATLPGDRVYYEGDAYRFLLEILCGLHSRVLGENEIVSQFKKRFLEEELPHSHSESFRRLAQSLLADMKQVRRRHPLNQGSHSYGSYCRKETENDARVSLVGSGELTLAILPWLSRKAQVQVCYRSENGRTTLEEKIAESHPAVRETLRFSSLGESSLDLGGALVIAAPLSAREIEAMILTASVRPSRIIDLRGESAHDPILPITLGEEGDLPILDLQDFFREAEFSNRAAKVAREHALARVALLSEARLEAESILIRTQGWEDLCG